VAAAAVVLAAVFPRWDLRSLASGTSVYFDRGTRAQDLVYSAEDAQGGFTTVTRETAAGRSGLTLRTNGKFQGDDFRETPPPKYFRLSPGAEVRLPYAYIVKCTGVVKDDRTGEVIELRFPSDPQRRGGDARGRKVKGTIHWVSAAHALEGEARLYDHLFLTPKPDEEEDWKATLNPESLETLAGCKLEPSLAGATPGSRYQFERQGYFCVDTRDSAPERLVWNRTVGLRDTWAKIEKSAGG
jgi:glutaminyl-tRNA synthetase